MYIYEVSVSEKEHIQPKEYYFTSYIKCVRFVEELVSSHDVICDLESEHVQESYYNKTLITKYYMRGMDNGTIYKNINVYVLTVN